ncbi:nudix hydrolase homolog 2 [Actinidia rufa]|uniref:Nudix hydrolase homolog 2 n=1 Tax=Actinidia rufa TaxID=165716 RepID=A0A7J0FXZ0_9ERIC|nr:nudix hydrolase homolog 2 [Actinidia rufa]
MVVGLWKGRVWLRLEAKAGEVGCRGLGGRSRIKVRFGGAFNINSMAEPASLAMEQMGSENEEQEQISKLLTGMNDEHGGVIVEMTTEPMDAHVFSSLLRTSISHWRQQGKKGVWIKFPIELVNLVEPAVKEGFYFHHAEPKYLMLVHWIPETTNTLPGNATHRVRIGAFIMNEKKEVLVVQEKNGVLRGTGVWKFPTGVVDEGEDICDAAVREVKEETGWMPFEEYLSQNFVQKNELLKYIADICLTKREGKYSGFSTVPTTTSFSDNKSYLYLSRQFLNNP